MKHRNHRTILTSALALAAGFSLHAQSILGAGDSVTWQFQFQYASTEMLNSPYQSFGGYVMLDYSPVAQAGPLEYRLDFFEDFTSLQPVMSLDIPHSLISERIGSQGLLWLPEFAPPADAWADYDGAVCLTVLSGQLRNLTPYISMLVPTAPGYMDSYEAVTVPEPSVLALMTVGILPLVYHVRRRHVRPHA